jgi:hypothetical protein
VNFRGRQRTARLSRPWRQHWYTQIGPLRYDVIEPYRNIRLLLEPNEAGFSFDLNWLGLGPAHLSSHHLATVRGPSHDRSDPLQPGRRRPWLDRDRRARGST